MAKITLEMAKITLEPLREVTLPAVLMGLVLSVIFGAANVYLGLKVGQTVSASIPSAVIAMGILHGMMRRRSLLESNLVQTGASAGEALSAGVIFTIPALIMIGAWQTFHFWTTSLIAITGGLLGILLTIPMRKVFVVDNQDLPYPEGVACAELLKAGEGEVVAGAHVASEREVSQGAALLFASLGLGSVFKFVGSFGGLFVNTVEVARYVGSRIFVFGADISPALIGVGYIVGTGVAMQVLLGGAIGWFIAIPWMGADPSAGSALDQAWTLWSTKVRYIGVGTMIVGGMISIWRVRKSLLIAGRELVSQFQRRHETGPVAKTERSVSGMTVILLTLATVLVTGAVYYSLLDHQIGLTVANSVIMAVMSVFFTAVAIYIVGLVGNTNSPVSGMTICAVLVAGGVLYLMGISGAPGMVSILGIAAIVCCVSSSSGDMANSLRTGYLLGASPRAQQVIKMWGVIVAALVMAPVLIAIHEGSLNAGTGGIGGRELSAPQAALFAALARGFFGDGTLPWNMVAIGMAIGVAILLADTILERIDSSIRLHVMPVAVGIYLPIGLSVPMMVGGIIQWISSRSSRKEEVGRRGVLLASGIIAGESIVGVLLAMLAYKNITSWKLGAGLGNIGMEILSVIALAALAFWMVRKSFAQEKK
ncbi:MAG TPA: oligopeptide transporter, OPT family [Bdellovibrionota bacterium]|nr:oligopeptide transporter, OPT family [Bdellovibrionota bacterium]